MFDRRLLVHFDRTLMGMTLGLVLLGVFVIYSATQQRVDLPIPASRFYLKQLHWVVYGLLGLLLVVAIDYHTLSRMAYPLYALTILVLAVLPIAGKTAGGSQRWLSLGPLNVQPAELGKIVLVLVLARYLDQCRDKGPLTLQDLWLPTLLVLIPAWLVARQPDLGTAVVLITVYVAMILLMGVERRTLVCFLGLVILLVPVLWWVLRDYQRERILVLFSPGADTLGSGYHILQSKIAIGSGGVLGKGLLAGTQSRLNFLPEKHTDFIFAVFSEETGFVGSALLLIYFALFIARGIDIARHARDRLGTLIALGVVCIFLVQVFVNIGMTIGLVPIVGLPLPFLSYGGSAVVTSMMLVGLLLNIKMRRLLF